MEGTFGNLVAHWSRRLAQESSVQVEDHPFNLFVALSGLASFIGALQDLAEWSHEDTTNVETGPFGKLLFDFAATITADTTLKLKQGDRKRVNLLSPEENVPSVQDVLDFLGTYSHEFDVEQTEQVDAALGITERTRDQIQEDIIQEFCEKLDVRSAVEDAVYDTITEVQGTIADAAESAMESAMENVTMERRR
jgi:hypothetical protein